MTTRAPDEDAAIYFQVESLYRQLLDSWDRRDANSYADLFLPDGSLVGFDGSPVDGQPGIRAHLHQVFTDHMTARYVAKVREVRKLAVGVALLRSVVGMVSPGQKDINPAVNAVQSMVAVQRGDEWRIALFQNTPAQFHGRPEAAVALSAELRALL